MCGMKYVIHHQTSMVELFKFGNGLVISFHTFLGMWLFIRAGIKVEPC